MRVKDLLDMLTVTGKIKSSDNIDKLRHKKEKGDMILSEDTIRFIKEILRKYDLDDFTIVNLIYAMTNNDYINFLDILYRNDYEDNFRRGVERFTGQRFKVKIYKDNNLKFGNVQVKRLGTHLLGVFNKKGEMLCKGNIFILTNDKIYREHTDKYMLCIDKNGSVTKMKKKKALNIRGVQLASYEFNFR